jgi:sRNA-binding carbon storage regulator CsrA
VIVHDTIYRDVTCYSCLDSAWQVKKNTLDSLWIEAVKEVDLYRAEVFAQVEAKKAEYQLLKEANFNGNMIILGDTLHNADVSFGFDGKPKITVK